MTFMGNRINPKKFHKSQIKFYIILVLVAVFMLLPILFIFAHAFKPVNELYAWPPRFFVRRLSLRISDAFQNHEQTRDSFQLISSM